MSSIIALLRRQFVSVALVGCLCNAAAAQTYPLIGVTGDGAAIPETLFLLSQTNASAISVMELGNGAGGEAIAFNSEDDLLYHASGFLVGDNFWESVHVLGGAIVSSGQFTGPDVTEDENTAMVFNPATGRFLVTDLATAFFDTTLAGEATLIGNAPVLLKGLAFVGGTLYGASNVGNDLYRLDPTDGSEISSVAVTLGGNPVSGMNGLATHPLTGALWGIFRVGNSPGVRHLGTVNPTTGVVTSVGVLQQNFAGIAFLPEPSQDVAIAAGAIALALCAKVRRRRGRRTGA